MLINSVNHPLHLSRRSHNLPCILTITFLLSSPTINFKSKQFRLNNGKWCTNSLSHALLEGTNNTAKSNHVSCSFLISYVFIYIFQLALISLNLWSLSAPIDPNPITDSDKFVIRLRVQYRTLRLEFRVTDVSARLLMLCFYRCDISN